MGSLDTAQGYQDVLAGIVDILLECECELLHVSTDLVNTIVSCVHLVTVSFLDLGLHTIGNAQAAVIVPSATRFDCGIAGGRLYSRWPM